MTFLSRRSIVGVAAAALLLGAPVARADMTNEQIKELLTELKLIRQALEKQAAGVPAEMHIFEKGAHGVGLANDIPALSPWSSLLATWLRGRGVIK